MRKYLLFLFVIALISGCKEKAEKESKDSEIIAAVGEMLDKWHHAAAVADFDAYFSTLDSNSVFIGTDATENWEKKEFEDFSRPFFNRNSAWDFRPLERNIFVSKSKDVAWFDETLNTWMGTCIGSGVAEKSNNTWKIKHYVLSIAIPNDDLKEIISMKSRNDSIFLSSFVN